MLYADGSTNMQPVRTMSSRRANVEGIINLNVMGERLVLNVDGLDEVTCQVECISGAFPASCILTQKYSNDGYRWDTITGAAIDPVAQPAADAPATDQQAVARADEGAVSLPTNVAAVVARAPESGGRFSLPLADWIRVTDRYGAPRGSGLVHGGIDLAVAGNVPVLAACQGVVTAASYSGVYGNHVVVDCGGGWSTLYGHLSSMSVDVGDQVGKTTAVGRSGSTGYSTGEHLHFEVRYQGTPVNPEGYLDFRIGPGTPLSDGPIVFPRNPRSGEPGATQASPEPAATEPPTPTATPTPTSTATPTPTATPTVTNTPTPTPTPRPPTPTPTPTPRPILR